MHSASDTNPTPDMRPAKREIGLWDVGRLLAGVVAGGIFVWGGVWLVILGEGDGATLMTQAYAARLSAAIVMTICGLVVCWLTFNSQRATERRTEHHNELAALFTRQVLISDRLDAVVTKVDGLATEVHDLLATEKGQQTHSAKARGDVAKIQVDLTDLRVGVAEMAQRMPAEAPLLATLKAYIDALFTEFRKHVDKIAEDSEAAGYVRQVHGRLNGSRPGPHLHSVESDR